MKFPAKFSFFYLAFCMTTTGCKKPMSQSSVANDSSGSIEKLEKDLKTAMEITSKTRSYLPYEYKKTGCNERALYVSMELAAEGMISSRAWIFGSLRYGPHTDETWGNHTAPILTVSGNPNIDNTYVLDLALFDEAKSLSNWVEASQKFTTPKDDKAIQLLVVEPANGIPEKFSWQSLFSALIYTNSNEALNEAFRKFNLVTSLTQITPFSQEDIERSCHTLHGHLGELGGSDGPKRQALLIERTHNLVQRLAKRGLYKGHGQNIQCPNKKYEIWFPPEDQVSSQENPILISVAACQVSSHKSIQMLNQAYKSQSSDVCQALKDYTQALNLHGLGLSDPKNQVDAQCLHKRLKCPEIREIKPLIDEIVHQSSQKTTPCKLINGSMAPRSCEDIELLTKYFRGPKTELTCWQKEHRCSDRLKTLLPNLL